MPHGRRIAEFLLDIGAVRLSPENPFTWVSGIRSPIYCDNRMIYGHPEARSYVRDAIVSRIRTFQIPPDVVAGTATAAIGWAALVADKINAPFVYVRSKPKEHGTQKRIEGDCIPESDIVLIEDLLSTGGSAMSSVEALRTEAQGRVTDVVCIFTYEFEASVEAAAEHGVRLHPLCTLTTLLDVAREQGRLTPEQVKFVAAFAKNPEEWGKIRT